MILGMEPKKNRVTNDAGLKLLNAKVKKFDSRWWHRSAGFISQTWWVLDAWEKQYVFQDLLVKWLLNIIHVPLTAGKPQNQNQ